MKTIVCCTLALVATVLCASGCAPDPLSLEQRVTLMVYLNEQLQNENYELTRRIGELSGGDGSVVTRQGADRFTNALADDPFRAVKIKLHGLTAGIDLDGVAGTDGLRIIVQPVDSYDHVIKRAGAMEIEVFDLAIAGGDRRIGKWEFTVDQTAKQWVAGVFGASGYSFELPWPAGKTPQHTRLTLMVRMTTLDGRPLPAQTDVSIILPGGGQ
jgi:hypothetical protein